MSRFRDPASVELTIGQKFMRIPWYVIAVMALIVAIGLMSLDSVAGGSFPPGASVMWFGSWRAVG